MTYEQAKRIVIDEIQAADRDEQMERGEIHVARSRYPALKRALALRTVLDEAERMRAAQLRRG